MQTSLWKATLVSGNMELFTVTRETEDEVMEQIADYIKARYPWAVSKYWLDESLDYFLEAYDMNIEMERLYVAGVN